MKNKRINSFNTGIASEYLILSYLYRMDLEAYISQGNKKSVDIRVIRDDGSTLSIDVKSVRGYSSFVVNNVEPKENHFIVFVVYNDKFDFAPENADAFKTPDVFVVPSSLVPQLSDQWGEQKRVMKGKLVKFKNKWDYIKKGAPQVGEDGLEEEVGDDILERYFSSRSLRNDCKMSDKKTADFMGISLEELEKVPEQFEQEMKRRRNDK